MNGFVGLPTINDENAKALLDAQQKRFTRNLSQHAMTASMEEVPLKAGTILRWVTENINDLKTHQPAGAIVAHLVCGIIADFFPIEGGDVGDYIMDGADKLPTTDEERRNNSNKTFLLLGVSIGLQLVTQHMQSKSEDN